MLTVADLRRGMKTAATAVTDDGSRAARAVRAAHRVQARRRRTHAALLVATVLGGSGIAVPTLLGHGHAMAAPTAATVDCLPGQTVVSTKRVAALTDGAEITIVNNQRHSVVVEVGDQTAVIAPGVAEGQYPLTPGRQQVRCVSPSGPTQPVTLAVLPPSRA